MATINSISLPCYCDPRSGRISKLKTVCASDILVFQEPYYSPPALNAQPYTMQTGDIILRDEARIWEWQCEPTESTHAESMVTGDHTAYFSQNIAFRFGKTDYMHQFWLYELLEKDWVVCYESRNGQVRVVGTPEHPMRFLSNYANAKAQNLGFSFSGQTKKPAPFMAGYENNILFGFHINQPKDLTYDYI